MSKERITCRVTPEWKHPKCAWCMGKDKCRGPVNRVPKAYSASNCPVGYKGGEQECLYCKDAHLCRVERENKKP